MQLSEAFVKNLVMAAIAARLEYAQAAAYVRFLESYPRPAARSEPREAGHGES
jgi:hypothetical protein